MSVPATPIAYHSRRRAGLHLCLRDGLQQHALEAVFPAGGNFAAAVAAVYRGSQLYPAVRPTRDHLILRVRTNRQCAWLWWAVGRADDCLFSVCLPAYCRCALA